MRKILVAATGALALLAAGCTATGDLTPTGAKVVDTANTDLQAASAACKALQPTVDAVPAAMQNANAAAQAQAKTVISYQQSVCSSESALSAAVAADPHGTSAWIAGLGVALTTALPAILEATGANHPAPAK